MSLGKDFERRRLMAAAEDSGYVWDVYETAWVAVEGSTSSASRRSTYTKMTSESYTIDEYGNFNLTNPTSTRISNLRYGDYLVSITNATSSETSGRFLYKIMSISSGGTTNTTVRYTLYSSQYVKTQKIGQVFSDTLEYPIDGIQTDGGTDYWYVLVQGKLTWDKYTWIGTDSYPYGYPYIAYDASFWASDKGFVYNYETGLYSLIDPIEVYAVDLVGKYVISIWSPEEVDGYNGVEYVTDVIDVDGSYTVETEVFVTLEPVDYIGTVSSRNLDEYPRIGVVGEYWYIRQDAEYDGGGMEPGGDDW